MCTELLKKKLIKEQLESFELVSNLGKVGEGKTTLHSLPKETRRSQSDHCCLDQRYERGGRRSS